MDKNDNFLVIATTSAPDNFARRQASRDSWLHLLPGFCGNRTVLHKFVVGNFSLLPADVRNKLEEEQQHYNDIVQVDAVEEYALLMRKTLAVMRWAVDFVGSFQWLMKLDDDSFLNPTMLIELLAGVPTDQSTYIGFMHQFYIV